VAHYLEMLDKQRELVTPHVIFGGKNPHPHYVHGRHAVLDFAGRRQCADQRWLGWPSWIGPSIWDPYAREYDIICRMCWLSVRLM
jgi:hypothetical protein